MSTNEFDQAKSTPIDYTDFGRILHHLNHFVSDNDWRVKEVENFINVQKERLDALADNPAVGICGICNTTIWQHNSGVLEIAGIKYHPICQAQRRAEAAEDTVDKLEIEIANLQDEIDDLEFELSDPQPED